MKSIDICAGEKQWAEVDNIVALPHEFTSENDIRNIKVASDSDYIYMLIECADVISSLPARSAIVLASFKILS